MADVFFLTKFMVLSLFMVRVVSVALSFSVELNSAFLIVKKGLIKALESIITCVRLLI